MVENKLYLWNVSLDHDSSYHIYNIVSEDKFLIISCPIEARPAYLICKGTVFQNQKTDGNWKRCLLPFRVPQIVVPEFVSKMIVWATTNKDAVMVMWNGKDIPI
ncbi:hypothetical protein [Pseudoflavonifractor phocaeensis]|uniref:hypothetical protein n=1 Tax=Pseudoflavonifractor phocaeensis TaxID=1870988 RepID=UPI00195A8482|nr:hypothetical protein [Pseudoflavonifractor phocaeensis]